jgi:hypothetical protein
VGDDAAAAAARAEALAWLQEVAATKVPAEFRDSFLQRYLPHRQLIEAFTRQLSADGSP